jgi:hypothetical protein
VRCHYCNMTFAVPTGKSHEKHGDEGEE